MLFSSFPIGRVAGVPIRLHVLFLVLLAVQVGISWIVDGGWAALLWFILLGPVLLFTICTHELGHCLAAKSVGNEVAGILLWPLGGLAFIGQSPSPKADMWVAVAGPLTHLPMTGMWVGLLFPAYHHATGSWDITLDFPYPSPPHLWQAVCVGAIFMNISLFAFNLLVPAYPLDGGRILVDLLLTAGFPAATTAYATVAVAVPIAIGIIVFGGFYFQPVTIMVGLFILWASYELFSAARAGKLYQHPMFAFTEVPPQAQLRQERQGDGPDGPYIKMQGSAAV